MDKKTIIAFLLIGLILLLAQTDWYKKNILGIDVDKLKQEQATKTIETTQPTAVPQQEVLPSQFPDPKSPKSGNTLSSVKSSDLLVQDQTTSEDVTVETNNYRAVISSTGATITSWELKKYYYDKKQGSPVQLIKDNGSGNLAIHFATSQDTFKSSNYNFTPDKTDLKITGAAISDSVAFELKLANNRKIRKVYIFNRDNYLFDLKVELINLSDVMSDRKYTLLWLSGINPSEKNLSEDLSNSKAYLFAGGDNIELKLKTKAGQQASTQNIDGKIDWVAIRSKYFTSIIFPKTESDISARLFGYSYYLSEKNLYNNLSASLQLKVSDTNKNRYSQKFLVYLGPLDYSVIKQYHPGFDKIMGYGPAIIRPFSIATIWVFTFLHKFIPNYGWVVIAFTILLKIVLYPLTRKSYTAMKDMQKLQPLMNELKDKYGKDPQRYQKEMTKLYKENGVNPFKGCLPQILQMPLLFAIFYIFRNTIELRQEPFIWWINDLSAPDTILLPFTIPLIGNGFHLIPLFLGASMFWQQKMTVTDPKQKAMTYFMPFFMTFIFYKFPSGLNLYYTFFNLLSILQQKFVPDKPQADNKEIKQPNKQKK
jgi:YidC/Oxa1 family membrane protein insertase